MEPHGSGPAARGARVYRRFAIPLLHPVTVEEPDEVVRELTGVTGPWMQAFGVIRPCGARAGSARRRGHHRGDVSASSAWAARREREACWRANARTRSATDAGTSGPCAGATPGGANADEGRDGCGTGATGPRSLAGSGARSAQADLRQAGTRRAHERRGARPGVRLRPPESRRSTPVAADRPRLCAARLAERLRRAIPARLPGAIRDIYGAEALPALDKAIARGAGDRDGNDSLDHLRDS